MSSTRQLAAILFADIEGYTAIMHSDELRATRMREKLIKKLEAEVRQHKGKIIKLSGDGALCSFDSAIESIRAAVAIQLTMHEEQYVPLRIGIHQADIVFSEGDIHGDGVNIASRIESLAVSGSILISEKVNDEIKNQKDIQTASLGKYLLKNVPEPVEIFAIANPGLQVPLNKTLEGKAVKYKKQVSGKERLKSIAKPLIPLLLVLISALIFIPPYLKKQHARNVLIPSIQKLAEENFRPPAQALDMALEAEKYIPEDSALIKLWPIISTPVSVYTEPSGAGVFWKEYSSTDTSWRRAGITPLLDVKFPRGYLRIEFRKPGYETIRFAGPFAYGKLAKEIDTVRMDPAGSLPENMVKVPATNTLMNIIGLEEYAGMNVPEFLIDKYEVTNKQYKAFMDAGGYNNKKFWNYPVYLNGKEINLEFAIASFTDHTGRQGPANWEAGMYPDGMENHPVTGVSWYEAAAYARYAGKQLPTVFHWSVVAATSRTEFIVPLSNFNGKSTLPVASKENYCTYGIYDLAGNAREWCLNAGKNEGQRFILGGGWNDPTYSFNDGYSQPAIDRSITNGFRCIRELNPTGSKDSLTIPLTMAFRDYRKEKPVDDKTFEIILRQFAYDKKPLDAKIDSTIEGETWTANRITIDAGYNNERLQLYIYLPKNSKGPYEPIVFFPGSGDIYTRKYDPASFEERIGFIVKSGRALIRPIYKGTFERFDDLHSDLQEETVFYKDHVIMWCKEISRTIDYLETRKDIQADKIGYLGWSWGGFMGGIIPAVETRIKAIVLNVGGMEMHKALPEADQINFLPRIKQPILMLNGKHDMFFPVETSLKPMFQFLGTPKENKKLIIFDSGHLVPRSDFVRESLQWFDTHLGKLK